MPENADQVETKIRLSAPGRPQRKPPKRIVFRPIFHHLDPEFREFQSFAGSAGCLVRDGIQNAKLPVTPARAPFGEPAQPALKLGANATAWVPASLDP